MSGALSCSSRLPQGLRVDSNIGRLGPGHESSFLFQPPPTTQLGADPSVLPAPWPHRTGVTISSGPVIPPNPVPRVLVFLRVLCSHVGGPAGWRTGTGVPGPLCEALCLGTLAGGGLSPQTWASARGERPVSTCPPAWAWAGKAGEEGTGGPTSVSRARP